MEQIFIFLSYFSPSLLERVFTALNFCTLLWSHAAAFHFAQATPNLSFSLTPTSHLAFPQSFCLGQGRKSSGYFPEDQTQERQSQQRQGPVPQYREQHSTEVEYCSTGIAAAWHLKNVQVSELAGVASARCDTAKGRNIRQPWKKLFVPALGAVMLHIFFCTALKGHMEEQYLWRALLGRTDTLKQPWELFQVSRSSFPLPFFLGWPLPTSTTQQPQAFTAWAEPESDWSCLPSFPHCLSSSIYFLWVFPFD